MKKKVVIEIDGHSLDLETLSRVSYDFDQSIKVILSAKAKKKIQIARAFILGKLKSKEAIYGVNTGFGLLSKVRVDSSKLDRLQVNLIRSHCVGVGKPLSESEVRAAMLLRANTLATGHSGVSVEVIEALLAMLNSGVHPWIPEQGSVGASGDLAPLAHLALVLIGEGKAYFDGRLTCGGEALKAAGLKAYRLQPKEGLSLINGTQIMTAVGALAYMKAQALAEMADIAGAMSVEALMGSRTPFDADISRIRPHQGQIEVAEHMRTLLKNSEIIDSHKDCDKVQDPYSLRCIPQVHGVARDVLKQVRRVLETEMNSVTDNPLVFPETKRILNGGNFHGEYVGMAMDQLAIATHELANISEQRIEKLINPAMSGLPAFLAREGGLNSGFMIVQVAAASLVSENKILCHPATVDSIPTSADKEDHVSMGTIAARKCRSVIENSWNVIAMEFLAASQGLDFHKPLKPSQSVRKVYQAIRKEVPEIEEDRAFYLDIHAISKMMLRGDLLRAANH